MKTFLRILTVLCYCLPFTFFVRTCIGPEMKPAYNKNEVEINKQAARSYEKQKHLQDSIAALSVTDSLQPRLSKASVQDTVHANAPVKTTPSQVAPEKQSKFKSTLNNTWWTIYSLWERIKMPTDTSLSGIGTIFNYKNVFGKILIGLSFILSLLLLFNVKFTRLHKREVILLASNILLLVIFLIVSLLTSVSLLWGFWLLLIVLFTQLYQEVMGQKKNLE